MMILQRASKAMTLREKGWRRARCSSREWTRAEDELKEGLVEEAADERRIVAASCLEVGEPVD